VLQRYDMGVALFVVRWRRHGLGHPAAERLGSELGRELSAQCCNMLFVVQSWIRSRSPGSAAGRVYWGRLRSSGRQSHCHARLQNALHTVLQSKIIPSAKKFTGETNAKSKQAVF
jgi:hypothetical protein